MTRDCRTRSINARLLQVGAEIIPVYGDDTSGWSLDSDDLLRQRFTPLRYKSLDELFFVLINMSVGQEGTA